MRIKADLYSGRLVLTCFSPVLDCPQWVGGMTLYHIKRSTLSKLALQNLKEELIKKTHEALKRMAKRPVLIRSFFKRCNIT